MRERLFPMHIAVILVLALGVRLLGITSRPIWYDEAFSILFSEKGPAAMLYGTLAPTGAGSADIHPLGYYTVLWLWMKAFGSSLVITRLLSIVAGVVSVYLVYLIGWEALGDPQTARLGMLFTALAPFQVHYAQEIRMYSFLALWLLLATYAYQRGWKTGNWKWWAVVAISAALAQYAHNLAAFYLVALALVPVLQKNRKALYGMVAAGTGALLLYLPWALQLPAQLAKVQSFYWVERPDISKVFTLLLVYVANTPLPVPLVAGVLAAVLIIVIISLLQTVRRYRLDGAKGALWLLYLSFTPPLLLFLFSQWSPVYIERALLPSGAIFCIWLAWAITRTGLSKAAQFSLLGLLGAMSLLGIYQHITYSDFPYGPFRELDTSLRQRLEPGDVIVHANKLTMLPARFFDRDLPQTFVGDLPGSRADTLAHATQEVLEITAAKDIQSAANGAPRVWYMIYERSIEETQTAGRGIPPDLEFLDSEYTLQLQEAWDGIQLRLYAKEP